MSGMSIQKYRAHRDAEKASTIREIEEHLDNSGVFDLIPRREDNRKFIPLTPDGVVAVCGGDCKTELINFPEFGMPGYSGYFASESLKGLFGEDLHDNNLYDDAEGAVLANLENLKFLGNRDSLKSFGMHKTKIRKSRTQ